MNNKVTNKDALNAVKAFADQSEKNVAFGILAETEQGKISTFIKGEASDILSLIIMQMAKENDFRNLLLKAVKIYQVAPVQKIIEKYEQDEQHS